MPFESVYDKLRVSEANKGYFEYQGLSESLRLYRSVQGLHGSPGLSAAACRLIVLSTC